MSIYIERYLIGNLWIPLRSSGCSVHPTTPKPEPTSPPPSIRQSTNLPTPTLALSSRKMIHLSFPLPTPPHSPLKSNPPSPSHSIQVLSSTVRAITEAVRRGEVRGGEKGGCYEIDVTRGHVPRHSDFEGYYYAEFLISLGMSCVFCVFDDLDIAGGGFFVI